MLLTLLACAPIQPDVHIDFVGLSPLEVDTIADDTDGDGMVSDFIAEEVSIALRLVTDPTLDAETIQPSVDFTSYSWSYTQLNSASATAAMPAYENGVTIHLESGDSGEFPIRAVSFVQKDWAASQFSGAPQNFTATLTLNGHTSDDLAVTLTGYLDLIFADFAEP